MLRPARCAFRERKRASVPGNAKPAGLRRFLALAVLRQLDGVYAPNAPSDAKNVLASARKLAAKCPQRFLAIASVLKNARRRLRPANTPSGAKNALASPGKLDEKLAFDAKHNARRAFSP